MATDSSLPTALDSYRKARFTLIGHGIFFLVCCTVAVIARRMFKMPPALLTVVFAVALVLFGGDILRFILARRHLRRLQEAGTP